MENLIANSTEAVAVILFGIGFTMLLFHRNLFRKLIGLNVMDTGVFLFLASMGYIGGRKAPIVVNGVQSTEAYINPLPANTAKVLSQYKKVVVAEQNLGQFAAYLRSKVDGFVPYQFNEVKGQPFVVSQLVEAFEEIINK